MLLVVDIGNTNTVLGVYQDEELVRHWRIATLLERTADEYGILIASLLHLENMALTDLTGAIVCSVVPPVQSSVMRAVKRYLNITPLLVGPGIKTGISVRYDNPREVGADRVVNAVAAFHLYKQATIIVDFGTATTFDMINDKGDYLGGAIAPGLGMSRDALFEKTSKLPRIELAKPPKVVGKDTVSSMQAGLYWGYVGLVTGVIERMSEEASFDPLRVIATGGLAKLVAADVPRIEAVDEFLTLTGLKLLYQRNR